METKQKNVVETNKGGRYDVDAEAEKLLTISTQQFPTPPTTQELERCEEWMFNGKEWKFLVGVSECMHMLTFLRMYYEAWAWPDDGEQSDILFAECIHVCASSVISGGPRHTPKNTHEAVSLLEQCHRQLIKDLETIVYDYMENEDATHRALIFRFGKVLKTLQTYV